MNRLFLLLYSMLFCMLVSCSGAGKTPVSGNPIEKTDSCKQDIKNTYEVYIPGRKNAVDKLPLLVILDAHGSGRFALDKFKQGAKRYPAVLIASNLIKNGYEGYEKAIQTLIDDVHQKYPVSETLFITGFSGGARMALDYGMNHPLNGVIMCGALASPDQIRTLRCPVISISGLDDFNFIETAQYLFQDQSIPANLKIELTNDSHSWPDSVTLGNALGFLCLSVDNAKPSQQESPLKIYCQQQQERINLLKQQGDYLKAVLVARNMSSTVPFNSDAAFASTYRDLKANQNYINQMNRLEKCLQTEINMRQPYLEAFHTKDTLWWKNEIKTTEDKIRTEQDAYTTDMYRRIKGFLGIASYSLCKQAINQQNSEALTKILTIYRMLEPENPDMFYFSAFPYFWTGNTEITLSLLKKALKAGFSDRNQLNKDFPKSITSNLK